MIEFRMLGTLHLTDAAGHEVKGLLTRSRRLALLAYLAASTPRRLHRRDSLLALFWPELDQEHARAALRQALHVLRGGLGGEVVVTRGDEEVGLDFARLWCDVVAFEEAVAAGQLGAALDCYQGDLLDGFFISGAGEFERWLDRERARLRAIVSGAARTLVEECEAAGDFAAAAQWARRATRLAPHDEDLVRQFVTLLDRLGDRAGAVAAYDEFAHGLRVDLETDPSAETTALITAVRQRQTAAPVTLSSRRFGTSTRGGRRWGSVVAAVVVAGLLVSSAANRFGALPLGPVSDRVQSLAVLPFTNLSADTLHAWYADGLTEALTTDLGRIRSLRVISHGSVMPFRETSKSSEEIGRALHVDGVVEGDVQQSEGRVRVDVRLVNAVTGYQLWADRFEEPMGNRFVLEDRVAHGILAALSLPPSPAAASTKNRAAYEAYLHAELRLWRENREDDSVAITWLEQAVALDPDFAAAQAELAWAYNMRANQFAPWDTAAGTRAGLAAERALRLDPDLAEAHFARGVLLSSVAGRFAPGPAIQEYRRALELNPNLARAHQNLGNIYLHRGLLDKAVAEFRATLAIDPANYGATRRLGIVLVYRGQYEEGLRQFRQVPPESNQSLWNYQVAWGLLYLGREKEASDLMERYLRAHPEDRGGVVTSTRAILEAKRGEATRAAADIRTAIEKGRGFIHFHHTAYNIASVYALLDQPQRALYWLRQAAEGGWPCYPYFARDPNLDHIRSDPELIAFMRQLKAQWEREQETL
ncbi:MAG TPA: tetratricopeptide repeat protein [Gemmatimonadales bacterium]